MRVILLILFFLLSFSPSFAKVRSPGCPIPPNFTTSARKEIVICREYIGLKTSKQGRQSWTRAELSVYPKGQQDKRILLYKREFVKGLELDIQLLILYDVLEDEQGNVIIRCKGDHMVPKAWLDELP